MPVFLNPEFYIILTILQQKIVGRRRRKGGMLLPGPCRAARISRFFRVSGPRVSYPGSLKRIMGTKDSAFRLAPPTSAPSISG